MFAVQCPTYFEMLPRVHVFNGGLEGFAEKWVNAETQVMKCMRKKNNDEFIPKQNRAQDQDDLVFNLTESFVRNFLGLLSIDKFPLQTVRFKFKLPWTNSKVQMAVALREA